MKTFEQRKKIVEAHMTKIKKSRRKAFVAVTSFCLVIAVLALVLFIPYDTTPPSVEKYRNDSYYDLIQKINLATYVAPTETNRFETLMNSTVKFAPGRGEDFVAQDSIIATMAGVDYAPGVNGESGEYVEVTDNQVEGVIESDIFKRSTDYIFYLRDYQLLVYSIAKEESSLVGSFAVQRKLYSDDEKDNNFRSFDVLEMYLSQDCLTITLIAKSYHVSTGVCTEVINLDVSDPADIQEINRVYISGSYHSSRMVDGQLLVMSRYRIDENKVDFDDPATFIPQVGEGETVTCVEPDQIAYPDELSNLYYTVICAMDTTTLEIQDMAAVLSYSEEMYVSRDTIYVTRSFNHATDKDETGCYDQIIQTQITGIRYAGEKMEIVGSVTLDGVVKDQYSMDQHNGILRVVTSTTSRTYKEFGDQYTTGVTILEVLRNVNLYCVDLENWEIAASVIAFAPDGEDAQSVRFDGDNAYVCTAEVITMTDPVYFFDLSDLDNITYTDTGTIDGYSTSLIQLGDGFLLGIGYGERRQLKIEVYEEVAGSVVSVCAYELDADFSEEYKSYYIDRENDLVGLAVRGWEGEEEYILLHFDGYELCRVAAASYSGQLDLVRATIIEGWLYVLSNTFSVKQVW